MLVFSDPEVAKNFELTSNIETDFQIVVPSIRWRGMFSEIPLPVAEALVQQKYNHIRRVIGKKTEK